MKRKNVMGCCFVALGVIVSLAGCGKEKNSDNEPPIIQTSNIELWYGNEVNIEEQIVCIDNIDEKPSLKIVSGEPDFSSAGTQYVNVEARDSAGNKSKATIIIDIKSLNDIDSCDEFAHEVIAEESDCNVDIVTDKTGVQIQTGKFKGISTDGINLRLVPFISLNPWGDFITEDITFHFYCEVDFGDGDYRHLVMDNCKVTFSGAGETVSEKMDLSVVWDPNDGEKLKKIKKMIESGDLTITVTGDKNEFDWDTYKDKIVSHKYVYKCDDESLKKLKDLFTVYDAMLIKGGVQ